MRLDFNVIWVEDQPGSVKSQITRIADRMASEGFRFNPTMCTSLGEVETLIAGDVFKDEVDLILVDWDLGAGVKGQDVIERIREVAQFKDVVFYSSNTTADLRRMAFDRGLEGIYCVSRDDLIEDVIGVFESLVKKVLDLDHTRGIVMGATSDIDHLVNTCLTLAHTKLDNEGKGKFIDEALRRIVDKVRNINKQGEKLTSDPSIEAIFKAHMLLTSDDRLRLLASTLEMEEFGGHISAKDTIKTYREAVVKPRNELGHMVLAPEGKPQAVETKDGKRVSLEEMRILRKLILSLREDFRALADALRT